MLRLLGRAMPVALVLAVFADGSALAATKNVSMYSDMFIPKTVSIASGGTIQWTNDSTKVHTSTGDRPLSLWDSGYVDVGGSFSFVFTAGGKYPYHCTLHQPFMVGTLSVTIRATPSSGPVGTLFTVTVASITAPAGFVYDIQKRNPGEQFFQDWMTAITAKAVVFDSTGQPTGTYSFRSRLRRLSDGAASGYSAVKSISVT